MDNNDNADEAYRQANDLYWNSDLTVDQVAEQAGLSRHALYAAVEPLAVDVACDACGGALEYPNRSSRAAGRATCAACGAEQELEMETDVVWEPHASLRVPLEPETVAEVITAPPLRSRKRLKQLRENLQEVPRERIALVGGAAVLGAALGAAATQLIRER